MLTANTFLQGRYRIVKQLGQGGMGTVYEAVDERLDTTVALKETHFSEERLRRQFESEARLLARLRHPALTKVIDHFVEDGGQFLVMEFIPGRDLWELLQDRGVPFTTTEVLAWADQLLGALKYLHAQDPPVVHRDIKPQNLKLTDGNQIILLDFGLAKGYRGGSTTHAPTKSVLGATLAYAPLEQILQVDQNLRDALAIQHLGKVEQVVQNGTGPRSDLYSLGATLIHLLTGEVPIPSTLRAMAVWLGRTDPMHALFHRQFSAPLVELLQLATALDSNERYGSAEEMRVSLREVIDGIAHTLANQEQTLIDFPPQSPPARPDEIWADESPDLASTLAEPAEQSTPKLSQTQRHHLAYWMAFKRFVELRGGSPLTPTKPLPQYGMAFSPFGRTGFALVAYNGMRDKWIGVNLTLYGSDAEAHFHLLRRDKRLIEEETGTALGWREVANQKRRYIELRWQGVDPTDRADWPRQHEWLIENLEMLYRVLALRISRLRAADYQPDTNRTAAKSEERDQTGDDRPPPAVLRNITTEPQRAAATLPHAKLEADRLPLPSARKLVWRLGVAVFALILLAAVGAFIAVNFGPRILNSNNVAPSGNLPTKPAASGTNRAPDSTSDPSASVFEAAIPFPSLPERLANTYLKAADGKSFRLSDYRGSIVVLNFWATWCGPCRDETPYLIELSQEYAPRGVNVIGLTTERADVDAPKVRDFVRQFQVSYKVGYVGPEFLSMLKDDAGEIKIPQTFIISRDGRIMRRYIGFDRRYSPGMLRERIGDAAFGR